MICRPTWLAVARDNAAYLARVALHAARLLHAAHGNPWRARRLHRQHVAAVTTAARVGLDLKSLAELEAVFAALPPFPEQAKSPVPPAAPTE